MRFQRIGVLFLIVLGSTSFAQSLVGEIEISGLWRTKEYVVLRELTFQTGDVVSGEDIRESTIRLKNLQLFSTVEIGRSEKEDGSLKIRIDLVEKWTIIPIFKAGGGGGINYLTIGSYDINAFGRYLELGGQYERLGSTNSGVVWFREPRFLDKRLRLGGDFWSLARNRRLYDDEAELIGGYTHNRLRAHLFVDSELKPWLTVGGGIDISDDSYADDDLEDEIRQKNADRDLSLPESENHFSPYVSVSLGRLRYDNYLVDGALSTLTVKLGQGLDQDSEEFIKSEFSQQLYFLLPGNWGNLAFQLSLGQSSSDTAHFNYYIGGLDAVRGYYDGQFITPAFWRTNLEYRVASIRSEWFVLQHILFMDIGNSGSDLLQAVSSDTDPFTGYGVGIRLISPRVYRLNLRLDYGWTAGQAGPGGVSFGFQQFF